MFKKWADAPLRMKALILLALGVGPSVIAVGLLGRSNAEIRNIDGQLLAHRTLRLQESELEGALIDAETGVRGYLLTGDRDFLAPYRAAVVAVPRLRDQLKSHERMFGDAGFGDVASLTQRNLVVLNGFIQSPPTMEELERSKILMDETRAEISKVESREDAEVAELVGARAKFQSRQVLILVLGIGASILALAGVGALFIKGIASRLGAVTRNARSLGEGDELEAIDGGADEVGELARHLYEAATLLRARESELSQAKQEADRANLAKSQFISRMSHELRTPLNAILGFAQLMSSEVDSATRADVNQILTAGRHLLGLINEVLDVSRIESGELAISMETVPLVEILKESVDLVELAAQARGIVIEVDVDPLLFVKADASRLRQIFVNLLSNAVKYNRDDGRVEVSGEIVDGVVRLAVSDTGPGLPDGYEEELFTPFGRLGAETTEIEGTGLGLAVSESLAEAMDGHLSVGRSDSTGTQFCLELMRADMPVIDAAKRKARAEAALSEAGNQTSTKVRVLQVEDNPSNIRLITRIMQRRPSVELVTATSGAEAIELAVSDPPDLILLDLNLPDMSGKDVLARFRAEPTTREVRVIMLSADASEKQINAMLTAGAARYVTKPIDIAELLGIIDEALRLKESEVA